MSQADMNGKQFFKCYELFYRTGKNLPDDIRVKYYDALMEYGIYGTEPTDPIILSLLQGAMHSIDRVDERRNKISTTMKGNQNAVKTFGKVSKQIETDENRTEQMQTDKNIGKSISLSNNISSISLTSYKKEERNKKKEEMLEAFRNNEQLNTKMMEEDVEMWLDYKIEKKQPYKNARSFCTYLVSVKKMLCFGQFRLDLAKRFSYAVDIAIAQGRDGLHWYDWMEDQYLMSKKDLYPNPKQNE